MFSEHCQPHKDDKVWTASHGVEEIKKKPAKKYTKKVSIKEKTQTRGILETDTDSSGVDDPAQDLMFLDFVQKTIADIQCQALLHFMNDDLKEFKDGNGNGNNSSGGKWDLYEDVHNTVLEIEKTALNLFDSKLAKQSSKRSLVSR